MEETIREIHDIGLIPVIEPTNAVALAKALCAGGLPAAGLLYSTAAVEALGAMHQACPDMVLGLENVTEAGQADTAAAVGARFVVVPVNAGPAIERARQRGLAVIPCVTGAAQMAQALAGGLTTVKLLPTAGLTDREAIRSVAASFPQVGLMLSGGVDASSLAGWLAENQVVACDGSWIINRQALADRDFPRIQSDVQQAMRAMLQIRLKHVGVNVAADQAADVARRFADMFGGPVTATPLGYFGSEAVEVMKQPFAKGTHGHMAMGVSNVERARHFFTALGYQFDESTIAYKPDHTIKLIYFKDEIAGFRIHLIGNR